MSVMMKLSHLQEKDSADTPATVTITHADSTYFGIAGNGSPFIPLSTNVARKLVNGSIFW